MKSSNEFSLRLVMLRNDSGLTRAELSKKIGIPESTLGNYERGEKQPSVDTILKLCSFYDVSANFLLGFENSGYNINKLVNSEDFISDRQLVDIFERIHEMHALLKNSKSDFSETLLQKLKQIIDALHSCCDYASILSDAMERNLYGKSSDDFRQYAIPFAKNTTYSHKSASTLVTEIFDEVQIEFLDKLTNYYTRQPDSDISAETKQAINELNKQLKDEVLNAKHN